MVNIQNGKDVQGNMYQNCTIIQSSDLDELTKLLSNKKYLEAVDLVKMRMNQIGPTHPMYPDFAVDFKKRGDELILCSKPLNKESARKYPPNFKGKFTLNEKYKGFASIEEVFNYSYEEQEDIEIEITEVTKMLGDVEDPFQGEVQPLIREDSRVFIKPREFPKAKPFKISLEGHSESYDYVLLRIYKIKSGNFICVSNKDQNSDILFDIKFNLLGKSVDITLDINPNKTVSHKARLKYMRFFQNTQLNKKLTIFSLEDDAVLSEGILSKFKYNGPFKNVENEINFWETILLIEEKFKTSITVPTEMDDTDLEVLNYLRAAIKHGKVVGTWKSVLLTVTMDKNGDSNLGNFDDSLDNLLHVSTFDIDIFGEIIHIPQLQRKYKNPILTVDESKRIHRLVNIGLNHGDVIKIKLVAGKDNTFEDYLCFDCQDASYVEFPSTSDSQNKSRRQLK